MVKTMLTTAQQSALVTAINNDSALTLLANSNGFSQIADAMNAPSSPTVSVWRQDLSVTTILSNITASDMPSTANYLSYLQMLLSIPVVDATSANVRGSFSTVFSGKTSLTNLTAAAQRTATRFEALSSFITAASPANTTSVYGYIVTPSDVQAALGK